MIMSFIESGKKQGATCLVGGNRVGDKGYFIEPTIFTDVKVERKGYCVVFSCVKFTGPTQDDMDICRKEIFGPVVCILVRLYLS